MPYKVQRGYGFQAYIYIPDKEIGIIKEALEKYQGPLSRLVRELLKRYVEEGTQ